MSEREIIQKLRTDEEARKTYLARLNERYRQYRQAGGEKKALEWAAEVLPVDVWNTLFAASFQRGSYGVNLRQFTKADWIRITRGYAW